MTLLFVYVAVTISVSFLCSILEAVLLSVTPSYVAALEDERPTIGERLAAMKRDIDEPLAAILSLNTIAHTAGAAGVGAQAHVIWGDSSVAIASALLTLAMLLVSEIIPKTLGARYWKRLAPLAERTSRGLVMMLYPLIFLSRGLSRLLSGPSEEPTVSRAELRAMADVARREGVVDEVESRFFRSLLRFRRLQAKDIMTPRSVVVSFDETSTVEQATADVDKLRFSRFPVYSGTSENVTGYVLKHDVLLTVAHDQIDTPLSDLRRRIIVESEETRLPALLDRMLTDKEHIVLLTEELGGVAGLVTLEDVVETLLDLEIVDEIDPIEDMRQLARQKWADRARRLGVSVEAEDTVP